MHSPTHREQTEVYPRPRLLDPYRITVEGRQLTPGQLATFNQACSACLGTFAAAARTLIRVGLGELAAEDVVTWAGAALTAREFST